MEIKNVVIEPLIRSGVPCISGTRIPVSLFFAELAADRKVSEIANDLNIDYLKLISILDSLADAFDKEKYHEVQNRRTL